MARVLPMVKVRSLPTEQLIALQFDSKSSFRAALHLALKKGISCDVPGRSTLIVEHIYADVFKDMQPKQYPVRSAAEFSPEKRAQLRKRYLRP